jgi:hypothetical protein
MSTVITRQQGLRHCSTTASHRFRPSWLSAELFTSRIQIIRVSRSGTTISYPPVRSLSPTYMIPSSAFSGRLFSGPRHKYVGATDRYQGSL